MMRRRAAGTAGTREGRAGLRLADIGGLAVLGLGTRPVRAVLSAAGQQQLQWYDQSLRLHAHPVLPRRNSDRGREYRADR